MLINSVMDIKELFIQLVQIPSPSGDEATVKEWIKHYLETLGVSVAEMQGNLVVELPGSGPKMMLVAHVDTVQKTGEVVRPKFRGGVVTSDGSTILGADNKAGVAILLEVIKEESGAKSKHNLVVVFTGNEEAGAMTSAQLPMSTIRPDIILNVDGGKPVGTVDVKGLGQIVFEIQVTGKSAHAALAPELGKHAVAAAAELITLMKLGRRENGDTLNVGSIEGGGATNLIPEGTVIRGELRSFTKSGLNKLFVEVEKLCGLMAGQRGVEISVREIPGIGMPVWQETQSDTWLAKLKKAAERAHVPFVSSVMHASSDANTLSELGIPTFSINRGGKNAHSRDESITLEEMIKAKRFIIEIIRYVSSKTTN